MARRRPRDDGFTLVEVLISLILLALMASFILIFFNSMRNFSRILSNDRDEMELAAVSQYLYRSLHEIRPVYVRRDNDLVLVFTGKSNEIEFITGCDIHLETGGSCKERLFLDEAHELISERVLFSNPEIANQSRRTVLLRNVTKFEISYIYGPQPVTGGPSQSYLPQGIIINLSCRLHGRVTNLTIHAKLALSE